MATDLRKKQDNGILVKLDGFAMKYASILLPLAVILLIVLITVTVVMIAQMQGLQMSVTEANGYYYHLKDVV